MQENEFKYSQVEVMKLFNLNSRDMHKLKFGVSVTSRFDKKYEYEGILKENEDFIYNRGRAYYNDRAIGKIRLKVES